VLRNGWESRSEYFFFRCGPHGQLSGAHDHADQLSFELFADGTAWLVDPGTYTYASGGSARNLFRLSESHNTLTVDGAPSSVPFGPFSWKWRAKGTPDKVIANHRFSYVGGAQDGYQALPSPVQHRRSVMMIKRDDQNAFEQRAYFLVTDDLDADSDHAYK